MFILRTYIAVGGPFFIVGMICYFWERRICYTWRGELCARGVGIYPEQTFDDALVCRRPAPLLEDAMAVQEGTENPGLYVVPEAMSPDEVSMVVEDVERWVGKVGRPLSDNVRSARRDELEQAGFAGDFIDETAMISDRFEDKRPPKATWGLGDHLRKERLPPLLRQLDAKVHEHCPTVGALRHVYVEYSPTGEFYIPRKSPHSFDGHEYVIVPLLQDSVRGGRVLTFSPSSRSRVSTLRDSLLGSWTTQDLDVHVPNGGMLRVFSTARFRWSWGVRPAHYYSHPANPLPVDDNARTVFAPMSDHWRLSHVRGEDIVATPTIVQPPLPWWKRMLGHTPQVIPPGTPTVSAEYASAAVGPLAEKASAGDVEAGIKAAQATAQTPGKAGAFVVLHYEGPISEEKQRKKSRRLECYAYGAPPTAKCFDWSDGEGCRPPTEEEIKEEGLFFFLARNYFWIAKDPDKYEYI